LSIPCPSKCFHIMWHYWKVPMLISQEIWPSQSQ